MRIEIPWTDTVLVGHIPGNRPKAPINPNAPDAPRERIAFANHWQRVVSWTWPFHLRPKSAPTQVESFVMQRLGHNASGRSLPEPPLATPTEAASPPQSQAELEHALLSGGIEVVRNWLSHCADPNALTSVGRSPLGMAAFFRQWEVAAAVLAHPGIDPNLGGADDPATPLEHAVTAGNAELAHALVAHPRFDATRYTTRDLTTILASAAYACPADLVKHLIEHSPLGPGFVRFDAQHGSKPIWDAITELRGFGQAKEHAATLLIGAALNESQRGPGTFAAPLANPLATALASLPQDLLNDIVDAPGLSPAQRLCVGENGRQWQPQAHLGNPVRSWLASACAGAQGAAGRR